MSTMRRLSRDAAKLVRYLASYWSAFVSAAGLGTAAALLLEQLLPRTTHPLRPWLNAPTLTTVGVGLLLAWPHTVRFWRRYRQTQRLPQPPLQYVDLIAFVFFSMAVTLVISLGYRLPPATYILERPLTAGLVILVGAWSLTSWAYSFSKGTSPLATPPSAASADADDPISDDDQDILGRVHFVDDLSRQILDLVFSSSFVFGLHGGWGEGKTSVLNLLRPRLEANHSVITVRFNPWYSSSEGAVIHQFYAQIERALSQRYLLHGLHRLLKRYRSILTLGGHPKPASRGHLKTGQ